MRRRGAAALRWARESLRRVLDRGLDSPWVPYPLKSRLRWRRDQYTWFARRPDAFTEKVRWKMLKDRRPLLTTWADRVAVRDYVARVAGPELLTDCYAVATDPRRLDRAALPLEFVAKVSHGWGGMWFVADRLVREYVASASSPSSTRFARRGTLDWSLFESTLTTWLAPSPRYVEWAYRNVPPRVLVEELLLSQDGWLPDDYKFYVFDGRVRLVHVDTDRFRAPRRRLYRPDWTPLEVEYTYPLAAASWPPPASLRRMIEVAEALGQDTDFVRVDLYDLDGRVVFGELTHYPGGGCGDFDPLAFGDELGAWWKLPRRYRQARVPGVADARVGGVSRDRAAP